MKVYVVNNLVFSYMPHEIDIYNKVFTNKDDAHKYFFEAIREARIEAYGCDEDQGELNEDCFELLVEEEFNEYELKITIECVDLN